MTNRSSQPKLKSKTSPRDRGWQDALQSAYPFKINRLSIEEGDVVYLDQAGQRPLQLAHFRFVTDNIRNILDAGKPYPSTFRGRMTVFDQGQLWIQGSANYLMKPFPGILAHYELLDVPLSALSVASRHLNMEVSGGTLATHGSIEYSPRVTRIAISDVMIAEVAVTYLHLPQTEVTEKQRVTRTGETIQKENNRRAVHIELQKVEIRNSRFVFDDRVTTPPYILYLADTNLTITNLSNHAQNGLSQLNLNGRFMGTGSATVSGSFLTGGSGPEFDTKIEVVKTDLTSLNPFLRAHGRFDVAQGRMSVYSELNVKNDSISGYVKPIFSDVKVYSYDKDKRKNVLQQGKEMVIGAAARIFKNSQTQTVATQVSLAGKLKDPDVSTWEAFVEAVRNAFVRAILPGFDRQVGSQVTPAN